MATELILSQHVKLSSLLRTGVRAKFRNGHLFWIDFLNVTSGLHKAKVNITMYVNTLNTDSRTTWAGKEEVKNLRNTVGKSFFFFASSFLNCKGGGLSIRVPGDFGSAFEAKRKVFNLIFNFNPLKYVSDLETHKSYLAEDPTGRSKAISFNFAIIREFKAGHNYLDTSVTGCSLLIADDPLIKKVCLSLATIYHILMHICRI